MKWYEFFGYVTLAEAATDLHKKGYSGPEILELVDLARMELRLLERQGTTQVLEVDVVVLYGHRELSEKEKLLQHAAGTWRRVSLPGGPKGHQAITPRKGR